MERVTGCRGASQRLGGHQGERRWWPAAGQCVGLGHREEQDRYSRGRTNEWETRCGREGKEGAVSCSDFRLRQLDLTLHQPAAGGASGSEAGIKRQGEVQCWGSDTV